MRRLACVIGDPAVCTGSFDCVLCFRRASRRMVRGEITAADFEALLNRLVAS